MVKRRRDTFDIIASILEATLRSEKPTITRIQYSVGLPFTRVREYVDYLTKVGLLMEFYDGKSKLFRITDKGIKFLSYYRKLVELLGLEQL